MSKVLILDYGSQFTQLIARRIREMQVFSEVQSFDYSIQKIKNDTDISAIILSGGPNSIYEEGSPQIDSQIFKLNIPVLGICYGMQLMAQALGGQVEASNHREYGSTEVEISKPVAALPSSPLSNRDSLLNLLPKKTTVWMSHGDKVSQLPPNFEVVGKSENCPFAIIQNSAQKLYGLQFHPEVLHTQNGTQILQNFLFAVSQIPQTWTETNIVEQKIAEIKNQVGNKKVLCGLSGGVDSAVTAVLISKAIGQNLHCVFVDHGLLRANEREEVEKTFRQNFEIKLTVVEAQKTFLEKLKNVTDPEKKRKIIGQTFIEIFEKTAKEIGGNFDFLAQGTLYPDVIESVSFKGGPSHTIKSHHNVGGLPEKMNLALVEPFREMFKDEVRRLGKELGLPGTILNRHPFPGPGLAIRITGEITDEKLKMLKKADKIFVEGLKTWHDKNVDKINHLIFDFDGVICDGLENDLEESIQEMKEQGSDNLTRLEFEKEFWDYFEKPSHGKKNNLTEEQKQEKLSHLKKIAKLRLNSNFPAKLFDGFILEIQKAVKVNPNLKLAIVSSSSRDFILPLLKKFPTGLDWDFVLGAEDSLSKEEKIELILKKWQVKTNQVYYFTDTKTDVLELNEFLGIKNLIGCSWGYQGFDKLTEVLPTNQVLQTFSDFQKLFLKQNSLYDQTWQAFAVLTDTKTVGVMGDGRTYQNVLALRAVSAEDGMTADWARLPYDFLAQISNKIINQVKGINRVVYDISSKPPATIEWE